MTASEILHRAADLARKAAWRRRRGADRLPAGVIVVPPETLLFRGPPRSAADCVDGAARRDLLRAADLLLDGEWSLFGHRVENFGRDVDWFRDPKTGRRHAERRYSFSVPYRDEHLVGNVKFLWEVSRHQHLTMLAAAYFLSGDRRYAERVADHLRSWWRMNPFLTGVHWCSGIEVGLRLVSWVWARRLLADWPDVATLFERNDAFLAQLYHHQEFLAAFRSRDSSANNHLIAEAVGQFVASTAFPLFRASREWQRAAARLLEQEAARQVDAQGLDREQATGYHGFVLELLLVAGVEADGAEFRLADEFWIGVQRMLDALASVVDCTGRPPRQGDSDDGVALLLDAPGFDRWAPLLAIGARLFGRLSWWPELETVDVRTAVLSASAKRRPALDRRPQRRMALFDEAGLVILRDDPPGGPELWCRCDHGPHGFLSIAAHAHADALAIELRHGGVEIFADPGTYCYHGEEVWRRYFRSTLAHNTLELGGIDQAAAGGPFLWLTHPVSQLRRLAGLDAGASHAVWHASHDGYRRTLGAVVHRTVMLRRGVGRIRIVDWIEGRAGQDARLAFHFGPAVACRLRGRRALLRWQVGGRSFGGVLRLPRGLAWREHVGDDTAGWYSPGFARKCPSITLIGAGRLEPYVRAVTTLLISERRPAAAPVAGRRLEPVASSTT